ncbi:hypothetical protein M0R45_016097 [Rubus argutus]|uniref:Uncharacterized protein n=1 Tax=Rubus argutus TaxID=59490 RepID=A0AAW1XSX5_RUBAR
MFFSRCLSFCDHEQDGVICDLQRARAHRARRECDQITGVRRCGGLVRRTRGCCSDCWLDLGLGRGDRWRRGTVINCRCAWVISGDRRPVQAARSSGVREENGDTGWKLGLSGDAVKPAGKR